MSQNLADQSTGIIFVEGREAMFKVQFYRLCRVSKLRSAEPLLEGLLWCVHDAHKKDSRTVASVPEKSKPSLKAYRLAIKRLLKGFHPHPADESGNHSKIIRRND